MVIADVMVVPFINKIIKLLLYEWAKTKSNSFTGGFNKQDIVVWIIIVDEFIVLIKAQVHHMYTWLTNDIPQNHQNGHTYEDPNWDTVCKIRH